jgi:hypothetical protein
MTASHSEAESLPLGMSLDSPKKGAYLQNMIRRESSWQVRTGLGQLAQFDTTLSQYDRDLDQYGYSASLGSKGIVTDFGNVQILSVHLTRAFTGNQILNGQWLNVYTVSIYDVTHDERYEEVLYRHTSEINSDIFTMDNWRGQYATARDQDFSAWAYATSKPFFFTELADAIIFGSEDAGLWSYTPAIFNNRIRKQIDSVNDWEWAQGRSENSLVTKITPAPGAFDLQYGYLNQGTYPSNPGSISTIGNRLVISNGRTIWFSDEGRPGSIIATNNIEIPAQNDVTAVQEILGSLLIFTKDESYVYQPNTGNLLNAGRITKTAQGVGCTSHNLITRMENDVVWIDENGAYISKGTLGYVKISAAIDPIFETSISNPLTSYYTAAGATTLLEAQPRLTYSMDDLAGANITYDPVDKIVFLSVPAHNITLCLQNDSWHIWALEATVGGTATAPAQTVGVQQNINSAHFIPIDSKVYVVGGLEQYTIDDSELAGGVTPRDNDNITTSYYILELGRGGALDRSVALKEDKREFAGQYHTFAGTSDSILYFDEPIVMPVGYTYPSGESPTQETFMYPVSLVTDPLGPNLDRIDLVLGFDNTNWAPVLKTGGVAEELAIELPPERLGSADGYSPGAPIDGTSEAQVYSSATGIPAVGGDQVRIRWDGATYGGTAAGEYGRIMNTNNNRKNPLFYIAFERVNAGTASVGSIGLTKVTAEHSWDENIYDMTIFYWEKPNVFDKHDADDIVQPVEWAIKTAEIGIEGNAQLMTRGQYLAIKSSGEAITQFWPDASTQWGLFNQLVAPDFKGWTNQIIDYSGAIKDIDNHPTLRNRMHNTVTDAPEPKIFNDFATWGSSADAAAGNYLVDDQALDTIAVSKRVKGESFSWLNFGIVRNRAERLVIDSIKAVFSVVAGRRRKGR